MSDRQPTRPNPQRRGTALPYPVAPMTGQTKRRPAQRTATDLLVKPLTNYMSFTKGTDGRWRCTHHQGKHHTAVGMNGYADADAAYREVLSLAHMQGCHLLLTSDFLDDLHYVWDQHQREAQATPRQWELP